MEEEAALRECESYIASHDVQRLLKECIVQLCVHKPDNPVIFLRQHFQQLERPLGLGLRPINFGGRRTPLPTPADRYRQRKTIPPAPPAHSQLALDAPHRDHRAAPSTLSPPPD